MPRISRRISMLLPKTAPDSKQQRENPTLRYTTVSFKEKLAIWMTASTSLFYLKTPSNRPVDCHRSSIIELTSLNHDQNATCPSQEVFLRFLLSFIIPFLLPVFFLDYVPSFYNSACMNVSQGAFAKCPACPTLNSVVKSLEF